MQINQFHCILKSVHLWVTHENFVLINLKHLKCKFLKIGVNSIIWQNFISESSPISLIQETPETSNACHVLCKSSSSGFHFDWQVCDTVGLLFWRESLCTRSFDELKKYSSDENFT